MLNFRVPAPLEHGREADDVTVDVGERILYRVSHACLRREADHSIELFLLKQTRHTVAVSEVEAHEAEVWLVHQPSESSFLEANVVVVVEIVYANDVIPARQQATRGMISDEPGGAGQ